MEYPAVMWPSRCVIFSLNQINFIFKLLLCYCYHDWAVVSVLYSFNRWKLPHNFLCLFVFSFPPQPPPHWACHHCVSWADTRPFAYILSWPGTIQLCSKNHITELLHFHGWTEMPSSPAVFLSLQLFNASNVSKNNFTVYDAPWQNYSVMK